MGVWQYVLTMDEACSISVNMAASRIIYLALLGIIGVAIRAVCAFEATVRGSVKLAKA